MVISRLGEHADSRRQVLEEAWHIITRTNPMPAVCGRICPHQCEQSCNRCDKDCAVAVNSIERFLGDWAITNGLKHTILTQEERSEKIAVVGAGPAGLACAYHLARSGYKVTIFEALAEPGGMLRYGIPAYRLPREVIDAEVQNIVDLGVEIRTGCAVGKDVTIEDIQGEYDVVFLSIGAHKGVKLYCQGEDADGVYSGVELLRQYNSGDSFELGNQVVVIGGGDTAIDAARVARRMGANTTIVYRRTRKEMPAYPEEIAEAEEEGVKIRFLAAPLEIITENGRAASLVCQRMKLGEPDSSGRRRSEPIPNDTFTVPLTSLIVAVSQLPNWDKLGQFQNEKGWINSDEWGTTAFDKVYAGGDVVELGFVTTALAQGKRAAEKIHAQLSGSPLPEKEDQPVITSDQINLLNIEREPRHEIRKLPVAKRLENPAEEIKPTLPEDAVIAEGKRCMSCGSSFVKKKITPLLILRRITQFGIGTLLLNSYFTVFQTKQIYDGPFRSVCVPGLNCHACPTAMMGCPIGMLQHFSATHKFPFFLIGFLGVIGLISGRFTCGWLCPWGLLQDVMHAFKRLTVHIPKYLTHLKYATLIILVLILPYLTYQHWFSKLCPMGALIAGIPWAVWNPDDPVFESAIVDPASIGTMFWIKMIILGVFLALFLIVKRPFCRTVCPLGATYALFNRVSLVSVKVKSSCTDCGRCEEICPMDLKVRTEVNSENCIKCLDCTQCEHVEFTWNLPWRNGNSVVPKEQIPRSQVSQCNLCGHNSDSNNNGKHNARG